MYAIGYTSLRLLETTPRELESYITPDGRKPFVEWLDSLTHDLQKIVRMRLRRAESGNFGDVKAEGEGVSAMRIHTGKGYRIYFGQDGNRIVVLLVGGDKSTQERDIERAKAYWKNWKERRSSGK